MTNRLKPPGVLTHALSEYLEKRYGFKRTLQENGMLIGAPDFSRTTLIPRGRLLLNDDDVCQALASLAFKPSEIDAIRADLVHYNPEPVRDREYGDWLLDSVTNKKRRMSEEKARWMEDFFDRLEANDPPSQPSTDKPPNPTSSPTETTHMTTDAKSEYTETYTLVEYLEKRYDFKNEWHQSGGLVLSAPNITNMKALIQRGHKLLNAQEVCEILDAFDFTPAQVEAIRTDLIGYKPGLLKKTEAAIRMLEAVSRKSPPMTEEAKQTRQRARQQSLQWEEKFFKRLDEEYEKNAVKTTPPGGIIYNYQDIEGLF